MVAVQKKTAVKRKKKPAKKRSRSEKPPVKIRTGNIAVDRRIEKEKRRKPTPVPSVAKVHTPTGYEAFKAQQSALSRERSERGREIGPIPDIADPDRREACANSLKLFCETYNPEAFTLAWAPYQIGSIDRLEETVLLGALYAMAEPRGGGKTTRLRMAALWAVANGLRRYVYSIGATDNKAADTLDALKTFMRFLPLFAADYPEISYPIQRLEGIANRAGGQMCEGSPTLIEWTADRIVLPTVPPPANWPKHWPLRADGKVPTSGAVIATSGLTGEGIRGSLKTLTTGEQIRPDLVLLDDPQTAESAKSRTQNATREQLISADVLGMAGPGKSISAMMACTIICPGDAIDRLTDRAKHPSWRGERTRMLKSMPRNMTALDGYFEVYRRCLLKEPPDFAEANEYWTAHRAELEAGAEATWAERKLPGEVSAIQSALHLFFRDRRAFQSEYQNQPDPIDLGQIDELHAPDIAKKTNKLPRFTVPRTATHLTVGVDVQSKILFYVVCAWGQNFSGSVVDYGTWPKQSRSYFAAADARPGLDDIPEFKERGYDENARIFAGLKLLFGEIVGKAYPVENGGTMNVGKALADSGAQWENTVREACRQSPFAALLVPSKGYGIGAGAAPMANWAPRPGEKRGEHWLDRPVTGTGRGRLVLIDTNYWKSFLARRLQTPEMGAGCLQLFGTDKTDHQLFSDHLTSEYRVETQGRGRKLEEWKVRPDSGGENHYFDSLVYATVAGSMGGAQFSAAAAAGDPVPPPAPKVRVSFREMQQRANGGRR